mgnify:CR=1 FL=1
MKSILHGNKTPMNNGIGSEISDIDFSQNYDFAANFND